MNSPLSEKESYTSQVAGDLERRIATGVLPPLSRLKSVRDLAKQYGVSKNIALAALKELDKKRLIHRVERKGIFVSEMASNPKMLEVLVLLFQENPARSPFAMQVLSLISSKKAAGKVNFYVRVVTHDEADEHPHEYWTRQLEAEVAKLSHTFHSDCVLVAGSHLQKEDVEIALRLPFPTLFIGNFQEGDYPDLAYNRIGHQPNYHDEVLRHALRRNIRNIVFFHPENFFTASYMEAGRVRFEEMARAEGVRIFPIPVSGVRHHREAVWREGIDSAARRAVALSPDSALYYTFCMVHPVELVESLRKQGVRFEPGRTEALNNPSLTTPIRDYWMNYLVADSDAQEAFNAQVIDTLHALGHGMPVTPIVDIQQSGKVI